MIELSPCPARRVVVTCDACSSPIANATDAVLVAWASRTALVVHRGECLDALRLQYPSTANEQPIGLAEALGQLVADLVDAEVAS